LRNHETYPKQKHNCIGSGQQQLQEKGEQYVVYQTRGKSGNMGNYDALVISSHRLDTLIMEASYRSCQDPALDAISSCQQNDLQAQTKENPAQHNAIVTYYFVDRTMILEDKSIYL
jgi:hypothetical protein